MNLCCFIRYVHLYACVCMCVHMCECVCVYKCVCMHDRGKCSASSRELFSELVASDRRIGNSVVPKYASFLNYKLLIRSLFFVLYTAVTSEKESKI